ncbi:Hypothetical predicted protein [Octopus vulgaris]|uniref:Uncharacterized protein n=1 Tax=Octopus vulgaris TaxID=6645 RepID=A0AA36AUE7_OCTVU|nr:Hypothetical predicted protein [Octopus vulgaris]
MKIQMFNKFHNIILYLKQQKYILKAETVNFYLNFRKFLTAPRIKDFVFVKGFTKTAENVCYVRFPHTDGELYGT